MGEADAAEAGRGDRLAQRRGPRRPALIAYLDTSAFVKLLVPERGTADVAAAWLAADRRVSSLLLYPETRAALARAQRARRAGSRGIATARERIEALWASIDRVEVTESLAVRAGELADGHGLRGYDAVHLASLEHVGDTDVVLVTADRDLVEAARSIGFATIPVP